LSQPLENYGIIGNLLSCALVGKDGSIDWLCLPRFDSEACFAALLGDPEHGRWKIAPDQEVLRSHRAYRPGTAILETTFETETGTVTVIDFMPRSDGEEYVDLVRIVRGDRGSVHMKAELVIRFGYGRIAPWVRRQNYGLRAVAGPDAVELRTPVGLHGMGQTTLGEFTINEGDQVPFHLTYHPSHRPRSRSGDVQAMLEETEREWSEWSAHCSFHREVKDGRWFDAVQRSLITLKLLQFEPTGGIVAAPTTSLPEVIGGSRNWDYRYCWLRDTSLTLYALLNSGYREEALAWGDWLVRAAAGSPEELQIMYGIAGERRLSEFEVDWLPGYEGSQPVRVGNAATEQLQLDVYGELMDALHIARRYDLETSYESWRLQKVLLENLTRIWRQPDEGIWEVRGPRRHFTHSKLMAWVAFDRAVKAVEQFGLSGPLSQWRRSRALIHKDICENAFDSHRNSFVQYYGGQTLDASLLLMPVLGFLPADDPRIEGTVAAIETGLAADGLIRRYDTNDGTDGFDETEGAFLACSFWLADVYAMQGRHADAEALFEHLLELRNDLGLMAEEFDTVRWRQVGNFPQAFSHVGLINTAENLAYLQGVPGQRAGIMQAMGDEEIVSPF